MKSLNILKIALLILTVFSFSDIKAGTPCEFVPLIDKYTTAFPYFVNGRKYRINKALILGIIQQESSFNPDAKSPAGAYGLTQIMPNTAKLLKCEYDKLNNPEIAIQCSVKFIAALLTYNKGDLIKTISGYNGGTHSTETKATTQEGLLANRIYDNPETKQYVISVLNYFEYFKKKSCIENQMK